MKGNMEKVGEYEKMEEKKNKKIITECLNNVKRNSLKKEKESKINISLKIVIPIVIAILKDCIKILITNNNELKLKEERIL